MKLFDLINNQLTISEEAYLLSPFRAIWDKDKTKGKDKALNELAYVFYMEDFRSDFSDIIDDDERAKEILTNLKLPDKWEETKEVKEARQFYDKMINNILSLRFLRDAKSAVDKMRVYFQGIDFNQKDSRGKLIYDPDKLSRTLEKSGNILENIYKLEKMVKNEIETRNDTKGKKIKTIFEDGI